MVTNVKTTQKRHIWRPVTPLFFVSYSHPLVPIPVAPYSWKTKFKLSVINSPSIISVLANFCTPWSACLRFLVISQT